MLGFFLLLTAGLQSPGDTVVLDVETALNRAVAVAPDIVSAGLRADAARDRVGQAGAWPNPTLTLNAENLGRQEALTGLSGFDGTEGQVVFSTALPFGWERAGLLAGAKAAAAASDASAKLVGLDVAVQALAAIGGVLRDQILAASAREEHESLTRFAEVLALQAQEGRTAAGDAARAELARGLAATRRARREAALAGSATDLARRLGYPPDVVLALNAPACRPGSVGLPPDSPEGTLPELELANARAAMADANITVAKGIRAPDVTPQIGVRRAGGLNALYLGIATSLPLFDRGSRRIAAAQAEQRATSAEAEAVEALLMARLVIARRSLDALSVGGRGFTQSWFEALERTITSAQARYDLGEGTLFELLDSRQARLEALDDYAVWQAEWWEARAELARLEGRVLDDATLCLDPFREAL